jgi:hypothetical protein
MLLQPYAHRGPISWIFGVMGEPSTIPFGLLHRDGTNRHRWPVATCTRKQTAGQTRAITISAGKATGCPRLR